MVNFRIKSFTSTPPANACKIDYGSLPAGVTAATIAATSLGAIFTCGNTVGSNFSYLTKFDIIFSNGVNWHSGMNQPVLNWITNYDLETIALHELGHAHLLWHTNNPANVMYFFSNQYKRVLTADDIEGGNYIVNYSSSTAIPPCTSYSKMIPIDMGDCTVLGIKDITDATNSFLISPNPTSNSFRISPINKESEDYKVKKIEIYDIAGKLIQSVLPKNYNSDIYQTQNMVSGTYFVLIFCNKKIFNAKIIKQ